MDTKVLQSIYREFVFDEEKLQSIADGMGLTLLEVRIALTKFALKKMTRKCTNWWWVWKVSLFVDVVVAIFLANLFFSVQDEADKVIIPVLYLFINFFYWIILSISIDDNPFHYRREEIRQILRDVPEGQLRRIFQAFETDPHPRYWVDTR